MRRVWKPLLRLTFQAWSWALPCRGPLRRPLGGPRQPRWTEPPTSSRWRGAWAQRHSSSTAAARAGAAAPTGPATGWPARIGASVSPLIVRLAGGLGPEKVGEAVAHVRPAGVDVISGVLAAGGRKDAVRMRGFVARARAALRRDRTVT